jgi:hypothetical protein
LKQTHLKKKSAKWVPKLLSKDQKQERVWACKEFVTAIQGHSMAMLDYIVTADETIVSLTTYLRQKSSPNSG